MLAASSSLHDPQETLGVEAKSIGGPPFLDVIRMLLKSDPRVAGPIAGRRRPALNACVIVMGITSMG
jgi:hypothetical protein